MQVHFSFCVLIWGRIGNCEFFESCSLCLLPLPEQRESFLHQIHSAVFSCVFTRGRGSNTNSF